MVSVTVPNVITIALIAVISIIVIRFGFKALGKSSPV